MKKLVLLSFGVSLLLLTSCSDAKLKVASGTRQSDVNTLNNKEQYENSNVLVVSEKVQELGDVAQQNSKKLISEAQALREMHACFLAESPYAETLKLSKQERKTLSIPPSKYYESEWELTMDPKAGRPLSEKIHQLRDRLEKERNALLAEGRVPGDAADNNWVERGPNNVGGRVRALMFDPNDATYETVYAGGVSGGLWKNTNISNSASQWSLVNIPSNLAVSTITYDPNNTNVFYVGTGESYVAGDVNGDGLWKSTDGGTTWAKVFGGISGPLNFESASSVVVNSPSGIAGNYVCYPTTAFGTAITSPIISDIVLVNDGTALPTQGCINPLVNAAAINGKIALIRRGDCTFVEKVKFAQNAGAIAVLMMNNVGGTPIPMGGTDATITIPSVMISDTDGNLIQAALGSGNVNVTLTPSNGGVTGNVIPGKQHINDVVIRNNGGQSEIFVAVADTYYSASNSVTYMGSNDYGLFKSVDGGTTWSEITLPFTPNGKKQVPNDLEIGAGNKIWMSTNSSISGASGGTIFSSTDGINFVQKHTITDGRRTQIATSNSNANLLYVLAELGAGGVTMIKTTNDFTSTSNMALPADADTGIPANDFCRQQAFYDLLLKSHPTNDQILYAGGIDLFRSTNGGTSWTQISKWSNNNNLAGLNCSLVHADQHGLAFKPNDANVAVFGNDGGVFYASNLSTAATTANISSRNNNLNITQYYSVGVSPTTSGLAGDNFVAGAQDNGSHLFTNANVSGPSNGTSIQGGDGAYSMFDQGTDRYTITNYVYNASVNYRSSGGTYRVINSESATNNGAFIAPMALDSSMDVLYSDYTNGTTYQIARYKNLKTGTVNKFILTNALLTSPPTALTVSKYTTTSTTLLVGTRLGKILRITNANLVAAWTEIVNPNSVGSISDIEYGASESEIFVTYHNYGVVSIWYTNNGGTTWQNKEGNLPDLPVKCILQNPLNTEEVIVGTELGVWRTANFSSATPQWVQSYNGMRNVKVVDMDLRNDNRVFAATYGRGIFSGLFTSAAALSNEEIKAKFGLSIYPNPVKDVLNIHATEFSGEVSIEIIDINGRAVYTQKINNLNGLNPINLSVLSSGVYVLKLQGESLNYSEKIILE